MYIDVNPWLSITCWAGALLLMFALIRLAWLKGVIGRFLVSLTARLFLNDYTYQLISKVTIPDSDGASRIDYVVVSRYGIFVIEVMHMQGLVCGGEDQMMWSQKRGEDEMWFSNPLHESDSRITMLAAALGLPKHAFFPVIVFVGEGGFKNEMPEQVNRDGSYVYYIRSRSEILLSPSDVQEVARQLSDGKLYPGSHDARHGIRPGIV